MSRTGEESEAGTPYWQERRGDQDGCTVLG